MTKVLHRMSRILLAAGVISQGSAAPLSAAFSAPAFHASPVPFIFLTEAINAEVPEFLQPLLTGDVKISVSREAGGHLYANGAIPQEHLDFLKDIVEPVAAGKDLKHISRMSLSENELVIAHPRAKGGEPYQYRIRFNDSTIEEPTTPGRPDRRKFAAEGGIPIRLPPGPWSPAMAIEVQNAWRRMTIADPELSARLNGQPIAPTDYQKRAVAAGIEALKTTGRALIVMATGAGKTYVAFQLLVYVLGEYKAQLAAGGKKGTGLFTVNNTIILTQALRDTAKYVGALVRPAQLFEGISTMDANTDVVFSTPPSLKSESRLGALIELLHVLIMLVDEVHHLPTNTYKGVLGALRRVFPKLMMAGFTATPVRSDEESVIANFGKVAFRYDVTEAWREGQLAPMAYVPADQDILRRLNLDPDKPITLQRGTELYDDYMRNVYSDERLPHLFHTYEQMRERLDNDIRCLIFCPNVNRARAITAYFADRGVAIYTFVGEEAADHPEMFEHYYYAFKYGKWPVGEHGELSPYADRPIPTAGTTSKLIMEGADAPRTNALILWNHTTSISAFMQMLGRATRLEVDKEFFLVCDAAGLYHSVTVMRYLAALQAAANEKNKRRGEKGRQVDEGEVPGIPVETDGPVDLGVEISDNITNFLSNEARRLDAQYGQTFPKEELDALDAWIARTLGLTFEGSPSVDRLREFLAERAAELATQSVSVRAIRLALLPPFLATDHSNVYPKTGRIPDYGPTRIIYNRLLFIMAETQPALTDEWFLTVFPEFDPNILAMLNQRAANLRMLRSLKFGDDPIVAVRALHSQRGATGRFDPGANRNDQFLQEQMDYIEAEEWQELAVLYAETCRDRERQAEGALAGRIKTVSRSALISVDRDQRDMMGAYAQHFEGLQENDFSLPPDAFRNKLFALGILEPAEGVRTYLAALEQGVQAYHEAIRRGATELSPARHALQGLLDRANRGSEFPDLTEATVGRLLQIHTVLLQCLYKELGSAAQEEDRQVERSLETLLARLDVMHVTRSPNLPQVSIEVTRIPQLSSVRSLTIKENGTHVRGTTSIYINRDILGRPILLLRNITYTDYRADIDTLETFYRAMPPEGRTVFVEMLWGSLRTLGSPAGPGELYVLPDRHSQGHSYDVLGDLNEYALGQAALEGCYILGGIEDVAGAVTYVIKNTRFTRSTMELSRMPPLTPANIATLSREWNRILRRGDTRMNGQERIAGLYLLYYQAQVEWGHLWAAANNQMNHHAVGTEWAAIRKYLWDWIQEYMNRYSSNSEAQQTIRYNFYVLSQWDRYGDVAGYMAFLVWRGINASENQAIDPIRRFSAIFRGLIGQIENHPEDEPALRALLPELEVFAKEVVAVELEIMGKVSPRFDGRQAMAGRVTEWADQLMLLRQPRLPIQVVEPLEKPPAADMRPGKPIAPAPPSQPSHVSARAVISRDGQGFVVWVKQPPKSKIATLHIDPQCRALDLQRGIGVTEHTSADVLTAVEKDESVRIEFCKTCEPRLPGRRNGMPGATDNWDEVADKVKAAGVPYGEFKALTHPKTYQAADDFFAKHSVLFILAKILMRGLLLSPRQQAILQGIERELSKSMDAASAKRKAFHMRLAEVVFSSGDIGERSALSDDDARARFEFVQGHRRRDGALLDERSLYDLLVTAETIFESSLEWAEAILSPVSWLFRTDQSYQQAVSRFQSLLTFFPHLSFQLRAGRPRPPHVALIAA